MATLEPLSTSRIANASPKGRDVWLSDSDGKRGFGRLLIRISPNGSRHFYFRYAESGVRHLVPLGPYSKDAKPNHLTLGQAREAAQQALASFRSRGIADRSLVPAPRTKPVLAERERDATSPKFIENSTDAPTVGANGTLEALCDEYTRHLRAAAKVSAEETACRFRRHLAGTPLGQTTASEVTAKALAAHLRAIVGAGKGRTAALLRSSIGAAYSLALKCDTDPSISADFGKFRVSSNPVINVGSLSQFNKARQRTLTASELGKLWAVLNAPSDASTSDRLSDRFVRLSLWLGGQRCRQLARATVADVDMDSKTLTLYDPKGRRTVPRVHVLPISTYAAADVQWLLRFARDSGSDYVFPAQSSPSRPMKQDIIGARVNAISKSLAKQHRIPPFGYSDLRRTTQTQMAALKIRMEVVNQILSHGLGGVVMRHYNNHEYEEEMREALEIWGAYLVSLNGWTAR